MVRNAELAEAMQMENELAAAENEAQMVRNELAAAEIRMHEEATAVMRNEAAERNSEVLQLEAWIGRHEAVEKETVKELKEKTRGLEGQMQMHEEATQAKLKEMAEYYEQMHEDVTQAKLKEMAEYYEQRLEAAAESSREEMAQPAADFGPDYHQKLHNEGFGGGAAWLPHASVLPAPQVGAQVEMPISKMLRDHIADTGTADLFWWVVEDFDGQPWTSLRCRLCPPKKSGHLVQGGPKITGSGHLCSDRHMSVIREFFPNSEEINEQAAELAKREDKQWKEEKAADKAVKARLWC